MAMFPVEDRVANSEGSLTIHEPCLFVAWHRIIAGDHGYGRNSSALQPEAARRLVGASNGVIMVSSLLLAV